MSETIPHGWTPVECAAYIVSEARKPEPNQSIIDDFWQEITALVEEPEAIRLIVQAVEKPITVDATAE